MPQHEQTINLDQESNESDFQVQPQKAGLDMNGDFEMTDSLVSQNRPAMATQNEHPLPLSDMPRAQAIPDSDHLSGFERRGSPSGGAAHFSASPNTNKGALPALQSAYGVHSTDRPDQGRLVSSGSPSQRSEKEDFQDIFSELMTGSEHEAAFLSRHYAEVIGPWYVLTRHASTAIY